MPAYSASKLHRAMFFLAPGSAQDASHKNQSTAIYDLKEALTLFAALAASLRELHAQPNLQQTICLANLRLLTSGGIEFRQDTRPTFAYISPEQTGRMNRQIDYRSDYYSIGIVMYELATGHLPFESDNAMEQMHSHIAKKPVPPSRSNPAIPEALNNIILKLLSKNAEDRYQSLHGLLHDIEQCRRSLAETGVVENFTLASQDICDRLQISQKLYGRENEYLHLLNVFKRVLAGGTEMLLVSGYAGIGKSSLVNEIHRSVVVQGGYFISGKFDQFNRTIPYSALNQAFRELIRQILTESESRIAVWRSKLLKALGPNGQLLIEAIPELEFIIGKQPQVATHTATRNSFNYVMQNFVSVFAGVDHPVVLFLDDLQWADSASLKLISLLMKNLDAPCLLLIGAYRNNEVDSTHPLHLTLDQIRKDTRVSSIEMHPLSEASIVELLSDTLKRDKMEVAPLAQLVSRKTLGNPFFIAQFLKNLHNEGLLGFQRDGWQWDILQLEKMDITENVIDLLTKELQRLPKQTRDLLTTAACIGNRFELPVLSEVSEKSQAEIRQILGELIDVDMILPSENSKIEDDGAVQRYRFQHDEVQQAAYQAGAEDTAAIHLQIGRLLLKNFREIGKGERIFDVVGQLNQGRTLLTSNEEKEELADLNLLAAKKARQTAAIEVHQKCIAIADQFGSVDKWSDKQTFMRELYMEKIHVAFSCADYQEMERLCQVVSENSATKQQIIAANDYLIRCYGALYKPQELLHTGLEMIRIAGIALPADIDEKAIRVARLKLTMALRGRDIMTLADLPPATDPDYLLKLHATMAFLGYGFTYLADSKIVLWVALEIVRLSVHHGSSPFSAYAYAVCGRTLAGKYGQVMEGYKFGKVSSILGGDKHLLGAVGIFHGIIRHRHEHFALSLEPLVDTYIKAMETGDRPGAMVALSFSSSIRFQAGLNLADVFANIRKDVGIYRKMDYAALIGVMIPWALLCARLIGESVDDITQGRTQEDYAMARKNSADPWGLFYVRSIQAIDEYYFGEFENALLHAQEAIELPGFDYGTPASGFLMWAHSLSSLALCNNRPSNQAEILKTVKATQRRFKPWADHAPMNYLHKWQLIEAEYCRVSGKFKHAEQLYDQAIKNARNYDFVNDEALSHELAGKFYLQRGHDINARMHLEQAHAKYEEWGALAKMRQLEDTYIEPLSRLSKQRRVIAHGMEKADRQQIDIDTVIQVAQTLSSEIHLDKLLSKLMLLLIENAGAQKGALLLVEQDRLLIQAEINAEGIVLQQNLAVEQSNNLSLAVINYVKRTHEKVVLGDAGNDSHFNSDPYISSCHPKSILCLPLQKQTQLVGVLYLENNLAVDAFTARHAQLLQILSSQIAISLENAMLYNELEQKIELRTQALSQKNIELSDTLNSLRNTQKQLVESAKMASLGQLVAGVAHEINTPVGVSVTGASTLAEETAHLKTLFQSGEMKRSDLESYVSTASTVSKLLLSNMERAAILIQSFKGVAVDQSSEERRTFTLKPYIEDVLSNLRPMLRKSPHRMHIDCDESIEVDTYPGALAQIITNLITNAMLHAFSDDAQGEILIVVRNIYVKGEKTELVELRFSDNGMGIPQQSLTKIFDPFFTTMRGRGGSGLGLNIIYNLVTGKLGGQIVVESELNVGTTFIVRFPRKVTAESNASTHQLLDALQDEVRPLPPIQAPLFDQ